MPSLEQRVARLEAEAAIERLLVGFVAACDAPYAADLIGELFATDAVMELGPLGTFEGRPAIHAFFAGISAAIPVTVHFQANYDIELDPSGSTASGRWYGFELPVVNGAATWGAFTYDDRYRRRADGSWEITRLTQRLRFLTDYDQGWARQPLIEL